jgi:hypothetical protein
MMDRKGVTLSHSYTLRRVFVGFTLGIACIQRLVFIAV